MGRAPCCDENMGLKKGPWTPDEDQKLMDYIQRHGHGSWRSLPQQAGLSRCGKSCRLRWTNYLRPDIKRGRFSPEEEQTIIHLHALLGNRWSAIASHLPRRTDNEIKNYWNTHLKKRLLRMGIDPVTHQASPLTLQTQQHYHHGLLHFQDAPRCRSLVIDSEWKLGAPAGSASSNYLTHMSQWDCVRAEAEARLASTNLHLLSSNSVSTITNDLYASPWNPSFGVVEDVKGLLPVPRIGVDGATADSGASTHPVDVGTEAMNFRDNLEERMSTSIPSCINPVDLQKFLQDWDSSLQPASPNLQTCLTESHVSTDHTGRQESPCSSTQHSSSSFQSVGHCEDMDAAEQMQRSSSELFQESVDNVFSVDQYNSPTSVSSNSRSPGGSTIVAASEPVFMPAPIHHEELHHHESDDQKMVLSDMAVSEVTTFWQRQQAAMAEAGLHQLAPDQCNFLPELEPLADRPVMEFGISNNLSQIPHFEFWCRGLHTDQNKLLSFESIGLGRTIL